MPETLCFIITFVLTATIGIYSLIATHNLIRVLIAMEIINKAAVLLLVIAGAINSQLAVAESLIVAMIIVEVVVTAIGAVLCIAIYSRTGSLDIGWLIRSKEDGNVN
ncbi:MAG: NADH-quinone oxidoreductase subunit K [Coriobacteriales bacterium]|jgi:multisubunit Na+/H+ antiporter MnhC subunit|nr:NADH-quinone oxidoreductase subunit K [Coriobacteriales bacterium]